MSGLDDKYQIIEELSREAFLTQYRVRGPEGVGRLYWFEVHSPEASASFYRYRAALKKLESLGLLHGVTISANPGRYYVFWSDSDQPRARLGRSRRIRQQTGAVLEAVRPARFGLGDLDLRSGEQGLMVAGLNPLPKQGPEGRPTTDPVRISAPYLTHRYLTRLVPGVVLIGLGLIAATVGLSRYLNPPTFVLPDLKGQTAEVALSRVHSMGLSVRFHDAGEPGQSAGVVLEQTPSAGTLVKPGRPLLLIVNQPKTGQIPKLAGLPLSKAEGRLRATGYALGKVYTSHSSATASGKVITSQPSALVALPQGATVDLLVSDGPAIHKTLLPNLIGLSKKDAEYMLTVAGLRPGIIEQVTSPAPSGHVLAQSPPPDTVLSTGSLVQFTISTQAQVLLPPKPMPLIPPVNEPSASQPTPSSTGGSDGAESPSPSITTVPLNVSLPYSLEGSTVRLVVSDNNGKRVLYEGPTQKGWHIEQKKFPVHGVATFRLYVGGFLYQQWKAP